MSSDTMQLQYLKKYTEDFLKRPLSDAAFKSLYDEYVQNSSPDRPLEDFLRERFFPEEYQKDKEAICKDFGLVD